MLSFWDSVGCLELVKYNFWDLIGDKEFFQISRANKSSFQYRKNYVLKSFIDATVSKRKAISICAALTKKNIRCTNKAGVDRLCKLHFGKTPVTEEKLFQIGSIVINNKLEYNNLPSFRFLSKLKLGTVNITSYNLSTIPRNLKELHLGCCFNRSLKDGELPPRLDSLFFSSDFNQKISREVLPQTLKTIVFGADFNQKLEADVLPEKLLYLHFGFHYNQTVEKNVMPNTLKYLSFGGKFNQVLKPDSLPTDLTELRFHFHYRTKLPSKEELPVKLSKIIYFMDDGKPRTIDGKYGNRALYVYKTINVYLLRQIQDLPPSL